MTNEAITEADIHLIQRIIPHRYPFLLIDKVVDIVPNVGCVGIKNVTYNEPHFQGHFPSKPIMPGVTIVEAMAQAAAVLVGISMDVVGRDLLTYFLTIDNCRFRRMVVPGDVMKLHMTVKRGGGRIWKFHGEAKVGEELCCEADIDVKRYATFEELRGYCYRVASVVGLVSARIFGCVRLESEKYAVNLGYALQITNILRDVGEDFREDGRIYLPAEDMARFDYGEEDLRAGRNDERFRALMEFEAARADAYFAASLGYLTAEDRPALRAAEGMRRIYSAILSRMRHDGFHVFEKRYRLSKPRMLWCVLRAYLG